MRINPAVIFRDEAGLGGILFNPGNSTAFGFNPVGAFIYARLASGTAIGEIKSSLKAQFRNVPTDVEGHVDEFINTLFEKGYLLED